MSCSFLNGLEASVLDIIVPQTACPKRWFSAADRVALVGKENEFQFLHRSGSRCWLPGCICLSVSLPHGTGGGWQSGPSLSLHHINFGRMHGALNVGKKKLITQFGCKSRDGSFEPS